MAAVGCPFVFPTNDMDKLTEDLIIRLQLEDAQDFSASSKGKGREGTVSDDELAFQLYQRELEQVRDIISDHRMTQSIARAVQADGNVISDSMAKEQRAAKDREIARKLGGVDIKLTDEPPICTAEEMSEEILAKLWAVYNLTTAIDQSDSESERSEGPEKGESSSWAAARKNTATDRTCVACQEKLKFLQVVRTPCGHEYCRECLQGLFAASMTDDTLFPPRCCKQNITLASVGIFLNSKIIHKYTQKKIESDTKDKTYCSAPECSTFIRAENIDGDQATCQECGIMTCTICKSGAHDGDCPADSTLQQVLRLATAEGWQRCYQCRRLVELESGCHHMRCHCQAEFCYVCGEPWKTCECAQWEEERLYDRAHRIVARQPQNIGQPQERALIEAAVNNLRTRHECDHEKWKYVGGRHQCEECSHTLPSYIFECRQCQIRACNRCRRNRL